jgi:DNA-directed RNA polymerase specialized sigma24 family protein
MRARFADSGAVPYAHTRALPVTRHLDGLPDDALLALFRDGHEDAFVAVCRRYRGPLLAIARGMLRGTGVDPEDITQQAFLQVHRAVRATDAAPSLAPWLYRIVRNRALVVLALERHDVVHATDPAFDRLGFIEAVAEGRSRA